MNLYFNADSEIQGPDIIGKSKFTLNKETAWHYNDKSGKGISDPANWIPLPVWEKSE
ncbi:MAG: hypothetical protein K6E78_08115 [Treponema sp.]|nr:hypothetical protein [Treponema sp.]